MRHERRNLVAAIVTALVLVALALLWGARSPAPVARARSRAGLVPILSISGPGEGHAPRFSRPLGVAFGPDGRIFVADTGNDRVCVFTPDGQFLFEFGRTGILKPAAGAAVSWQPGRFNFPAGIAVDENGEVYVADTHNDQIQVFSPDGLFRRSFPDPTRKVGRGSSGAGGGIAVTSIAARNGIVVATDRYQVFTFDAKGRLLHQFGRPGRGPGDLDHPGGSAIADDGTIYVSDSNHARLTAFRPDGRVLWNLGNIPAGLSDSSRRTFSLPRGIAVAGDRLIVADALGFRLVAVSSAGEVLRRLGTRGVDPATFNFPNDVDVSGEFVLVCDRGNNRVQVVRIEGDQ